ncbi:hypothetical protein L2E82_21912 [Cichorium intybus]|uniref:Uncharacterized protein n=1 Tax=Cichorium intybus TaxID=13427 RepID=A0ACB9DWP0_CICIN|nr:hypothetical protein L2E82_21912 [Cichorium intybus]
MKASKFMNTRIFDADHEVLMTFKGFGIEIIIGLGNEFLRDISEGLKPTLGCGFPNLVPSINRRVSGVCFNLHEINPGVYDKKTKLHYGNMFEAQIDASYAALAMPRCEM